MYKIAGRPRKFGALSPSDSSITALGFDSREAAQAHADHMNSVLEQYPLHWNQNYWSKKPDPWIVIENGNC